MADDDAAPPQSPHPDASTAPTSGTSTPTTPSSSSADAAKARREARKAKILGSGSDRLARITRSGRGADAETLYPSSPSPGPVPNAGSSSPGATAGGGTNRSTGARAPSPYLDEEPLGGPLAGLTRADDPLGLGPGAGFGDGQGAGGGFDLAAMLTRLQQHAAAAQGQGGAGAGGEGEGGAGGLPFDINQLLALAGMAQGGGGGPGGAGGAGGPPGSAPGSSAQAAAPPQGKIGRTALDKAFDLLRALIMIVFAFLAVSSLFSRPSTDLLTGTGAKEGILSTDDHQAHLLQRWASLAYRKPAEWEAQFFQMESFGLTSSTVPIFWLFISVELALQSSRILLFANRPPPPSILNTALNILPVPPQLAQLIRTGASYVGLLSALLNDLAIVLFGVGLTILWAQWKTGMSHEGASALGGVWDAAKEGHAAAVFDQATATAAAVFDQATATAAAAASTISESASAAFEVVTQAVNAGAEAAAQRAAEL
ncbi:hypothetical protein OC844_005158 [Tilletia horrida]|nr:hypothetical protein OC844_005158 [Tilletia horrida]